MNNTEIESTLIELFRRAGTAHHQAFLEQNGADSEWPEWYALFLHDDLCKLLNRDITRSEMIYWCVRLYKEHQIHAPQSPWATY
ncbi:MAG: hypothetical protein HC806_06345 [Anaerolineae bacterium]|nr:hypothetical protein [Anaerolineae bacterium]